MGKNNQIHTAVPVELEKQMQKILLDCERLGIFLNKKNAYLILNEKSKRGIMTDLEIKSYLQRVRGILGNEPAKK